MPSVRQCAYAHTQTVDRPVKEEFMLGNRHRMILFASSCKIEEDVVVEEDEEEVEV